MLGPFLEPAMTTTERRLTAILCADVAGFSRLVGLDETGTLARLSEARAIVRAAVDGHGGRVFNLAGDGMLAEFPSALAAVQAALAAQDQLAAWAAEQPEDRRIRLRIGVHLGDVVVSGDDLLGDGVNVAARLQGIAAPGGISLSSAVHDQVRGRIPTGFADLGPQRMKNLGEPVRVFALPPAGAAPHGGVGGGAWIATLQRRPLLKRFLLRLAGALVVLAILLAVDLLVHPDRMWIHWPALGIALALILRTGQDLLWSRHWPGDRRAG